MTQFKIISVRGARPFQNKTLDLIVHHKSVDEVIALLKKGRGCQVQGGDYIEHAMFVFQDERFENLGKAATRLSDFPEESEWLCWYARLMSYNYLLEGRYVSELVAVLNGIEYVEFPSLELPVDP